jgi:hypothetical protein
MNLGFLYYYCFYYYCFSYAKDLLEAYWRDKSTAKNSSSNNYQGYVSSKASANGKSAHSNNKKSSRVALHESQSNGTANSTKNEENLEKETPFQNPRLSILYENNPSKTDRSENYPPVDGQESSTDIEDDDDSSSENESSSDNDATFEEMEIDEEGKEEVKDASQCSPKTKIGPRKPKSHNRAHEKESLYDDRGVKSIMRNIDENWDPYVEEVIAIEPHDKRPNALWVYILW